jgi:hypothetical protein
MAFGALVSVALGILSVMILFSLAATALQEAIAQLLNTRGKRLRDGIIVLLEANFPQEINTENAFEFFYGKFYETAKLNALTAVNPPNKFLRVWDRFKTMLRGGQRKLPSGIEPRRYAEAMISLIGDKEERNKLALGAKSVVEAGERLLVDEMRIVGDALDVEAFAKTAETVEKVSDALQTRIDRAQSVVDARLQELEEEFNQTMDRVSGWYARQVKMSLFIIGLFLAAGANIDLIGYAQRLLADENLRNKAEIYAQLLSTSDAVPRETTDVIEDAGETVVADIEGQSESSISPDSLAGLMGELDRLEVRIGWCEAMPVQADSEPLAPSTEPGEGKRSSGLCPDGEQFNGPPTLFQVVGWFLIAFGVTLGAQFWFNLFRALLNLRTSGRVRSGANTTST